MHSPQLDRTHRHTQGLFFVFNSKRIMSSQKRLTLIVLSSDAVNKYWPSDEKSTLRTAAECAVNTVDSPLLKHQKRKIACQTDSCDAIAGKTHTRQVSIVAQSCHVNPMRPVGQMVKSTRTIYCP
jgi:hypothetical protein